VKLARIEWKNTPGRDEDLPATRKKVRLRRVKREPLLGPDPSVSWRSRAVFNPGAGVYEGRLFLLYRATSLVEEDGWHSCLGLAISSDGVNFELHPEPLVRPVCDLSAPCWETRGVEDPRVTFLEGTWHLLTTAFGGRYPGDWKVALRSGVTPFDWMDVPQDVLGLPGCKNAALLPERIEGRIWLFFRPPQGEIWVASGRELGRWEEMRLVMRPRKGWWDEARVGIGPPPIRLPDGRWLMIYHGADRENTYRLGLALLHPERPWEVIARQEEPLLEPELPWEKKGLVPRAVFSCGAAELGEDLLVYYGAADTVIGAAWLPRKDLLAL